ncbi:hypothetical protein T310_0711 [Rasamsonia emersonii CBS 393.64]|uniref:Uncharacterized protein n=1 Tax=Rasamsonia emersonii (strain ATCC 16479 / CBS 393.64 / IMI 116815) TaxID=1408163 RepID=A0A0F4Z414_RASE3|nr:hypothetical protein T310_0711 [Rasamsonia emersonii CBS 393.64]KKA25259.1 hypothetical protein T310_0711 [Rasamsonia emersonii CBS 393.64]
MHVPDPGWSNSAEKPTESGLHKRDWHMDLKYATHFMRKACGLISGGFFRDNRLSFAAHVDSTSRSPKGNKRASDPKQAGGTAGGYLGMHLSLKHGTPVPVIQEWFTGPPISKGTPTV